MTSGANNKFSRQNQGGTPPDGVHHQLDRVGVGNVNLCFATWWRQKCTRREGIGRVWTTLVALTTLFSVPSDIHLAEETPVVVATLSPRFYNLFNLFKKKQNKYFHNVRSKMRTSMDTVSAASDSAVHQGRCAHSGCFTCILFMARFTSE